jgi:hypothetical protein
MKYSYCGLIDVGNSGLKRLLQKGRTLMITTERGPADEVELQRQTLSKHKHSMARNDCFTLYVMFFFQCCYMKTHIKPGAAPASSNSVDGADEPCAS